MSVFDWENFYDWRRDVIYIIANMWGEKALVVSDDLAPLIGTQEWLTDLLGKARGDPIAEISSEISKRWQSIKVYHACCPEQTKSYYQYGIKRKTIRELEKYALEFYSEFHKTKNVENIVGSMRKLYTQLDEKVFVSIDRKHIKKYCAHYLLYGSEFILLYGILLGTQFDCQDEILMYIKQNVGMPTIFQCNLPIAILPEDVLYELSAILLAETYRWLRDNRYSPPSRRFGFGIRKTISPAWILEHEHPTINDYFIPPIWHNVPGY